MKIDDNGFYITWKNLIYGLFHIILASLLLINSLFTPFSVFFLGCLGLLALVLFFPTDVTRVEKEDIKALFYYLTFLFINTFFGAIGYFTGLWETSAPLYAVVSDYYLGG